MKGESHWLVRLHRPAWHGPQAVAGLIALVLGASQLMPALPAVKSGPPAAPSSVVTTSTDHPDEAKLAVYHSAATGAQPKYLSLPTIKTEGYIQAVGIDQHQQIAVPTNIHLAGWFASTVTPGELGLSIIDGHLNGRTGTGVFAHLADLKPGDRFTVELANATRRVFEVRAVDSLPTEGAAAVLFSQIPGVSRQLNLITCDGDYDRVKGYDRRVVVSAALVK